MSEIIASVVIPVYNNAHLIKYTLDSVLQQTIKNYEIIVVNDGSTDNLHESLVPYMDKIILIDQENQGVSAARNHGSKIARGKYIAYLDADDIFTPDKLEKYITLLEENSDILYAFSDFNRYSIKTGEAYELSNSQIFDFDSVSYILDSTIWIKVKRWA